MSIDYSKINEHMDDPLSLNCKKVFQAIEHLSETEKKEVLEQCLDFVECEIANNELEEDWL